MTLYKEELLLKASELCGRLKDHGIDAFFDDGFFRDYALSMVINKDNQNCGRLSIYYKPSKNTYSLKQQITDAEISKTIDSVWNDLNGSASYGAESGIYEAFVDGSYISGVTGYGAVVYLGEELKASIAGTILDVEFRQFGGELQSVIEVLKWCSENGVKKVRINYDYQGIEKFATGEWKAKNDLSKEYTAFVKSSGISIQWRHIKSHTGNRKNDEADALAKKAATAASSTVSKRFINLENKALDFINYINKKSDFNAQYVGAENGEKVKIKIKNAERGHSAVIDLIYAKANSFSLRQPKSGIESDIYNLWQDFLFLQDFSG